MKHIIVIPWLGVSGGSEKITQLLLVALKGLYRPGELCVVAPDLNFSFDTSDRERYGVPIIAINDLAPEADRDGRVEIFDRIMTESRPATVHTVNSDIAWLAFMEHGKAYASDSALFGNIYSDVLYDNRLRLGAFWQYLPRCIEFMSGVLADNAAVLQRAQELFSLPRSLMDKAHVIRTPIVGVHENDARTQIRPYRPDAESGTLWMSRVAREKRLDVLAAVARHLPQRPFAMYGAIFKAALPPDLSWLDTTPNVDFRGRYGDIQDLSLSEFSNYIFTSSAEGMPIAILEAAMLGLPVIAPKIGGIPEFVDDSTGWLVNGADDVDGYVAAIRESDKDRGLAAKKVAAAQARLNEEYSWDAFLNSLKSIPSYLAR